MVQPGEHAVGRLGCRRLLTPSAPRRAVGSTCSHAACSRHRAVDVHRAPPSGPDGAVRSGRTPRDKRVVRTLPATREGMGKWPGGQAASVPVLIVDDQAPFRRAARAVVTATAGFDVVGEAESGEEAVEMADALEPGLVLMDINLPGHQRHRGDPPDHQPRIPRRW